MVVVEFLMLIRGNYKIGLGGAGVLPMYYYVPSMAELCARLLVILYNNFVQPVHTTSNTPQNP